MCNYTNLGNVTKLLKEVDACIEKLNLGDARKRLRSIISELDELPMDIIEINTSALRGYRSSIESSARQEAEESFRLRLEDITARQNEEMERRVKSELDGRVEDEVQRRLTSPGTMNNPEATT